MKTEKQNLNAGPSSIVRLFGTISILLAVTFVSVSAQAETSSDAELKALRKTVNELIIKIDKIENDKKSEDAEKFNSGSPVSFGSIPEKLHVGGYGELHANFGEGKDADLIDLHRLVIYLGYDFSDWIQFHSETEIEHAFVTDGAGGELVIEQAYFDFLLSDGLNIRAGRVLTPLGIINKWHEPTLFNSVERPSFAKYIIPSTWSSDGIGIFGDLSDEVSYEAYVVGGLDGSAFGDKAYINGIRKGRMKERPGLHEPAFTGRIDYTPYSDLRLGLSAYTGGLDNTNQSKGLTGVDADIQIYSADFSYTVSKFDFTGAIAHTNIEGAKNLNTVGSNVGVASQTFGWYLEGAYHCWPKAWKKGRFAKTDAVVFARYDAYDTQYKMPAGTAADPRGDRNQITFGTAIKLTPNFVIKADYQISDDKTANDLGDKINLGIGFSF